MLLCIFCPHRSGRQRYKCTIRAKVNNSVGHVAPLHNRADSRKINIKRTNSEIIDELVRIVHLKERSSHLVRSRPTQDYCTRPPNFQPLQMKRSLYRTQSPTHRSFPESFSLSSEGTLLLLDTRFFPLLTDTSAGNFGRVK